MLPNTYRKLKYIESSGTQYITTGMSCTSDITFELNAMNISAGSYMGATRDGRSNYVGASNGYYYLGWGENGGATTVPVDSNYHTFKIDNGRQYLDGVDLFAVGSRLSEIEIFLFRTNYQLPNYSSIRLKYCKMYQNGTLVRDFIPALRKSDNVPGLYDSVNDMFYVNTGSGDFKYEVDNSVYVKVSGTWKPATLYLKVNGAWKEGSLRVKANNAWKGNV